MGCVQCVWICSHDILDCFMKLKIRYLNHRIIKLVSVNDIDIDKEDELEKRVNMFYLCNTIHDTKMLNNFMGHEIKSLSFYYKDKYVYIDIINKEISVDYTPFNSIILNDISLVNCQEID